MNKLFILVLLFTGQFLRAQIWIPYRATVNFDIRNAGIPVKGTFDSVAIRLNRGPEGWNGAKLSGQVFAGSIDTGIGLRDKHLRNENYFEVEAYPWIHMESNVLKSTGNGQVEGIFVLTIKDHKKDIPLTFTCTESEKSIILFTEFELDRREFDLGGNSLILADRVRVFVNAEFRHSK
jgi:polyisoprenoid-binding protein YceI